MEKFILGTKQQMTQVFDEDGRAHPVTIIAAGPVTITQIKNKQRDNYEAVQLGFGVRAGKNIGKAVLGATKEARKEVGLSEKQGFRFLREYRGEISEDTKIGKHFDVSVFEEGDKVSVSAISKGKGFQGVVKRWGFHGGPRSHGNRHGERSPGSIGSQGPQRVFKGKKMAGRMGHKRITVKNLRVVRIDKDNNLLFLRGAVPGVRGALVEIKSAA